MTWPDQILYGHCPLCGHKTQRYRNLEPLDPDEAQSILLHEQFELYYERRCAQLGVPASGPLPDPFAGLLPS